MSTVRPERLSDITTGFDVLDYLLDESGLNYGEFVTIPDGLRRNQGTNDWYEAHLVDLDGEGVIRYIELSQGGDSPSFSDVKKHLKRYGTPIDELFVVVAYREEDDGPLTSPVSNELTFLYIDEQFSSEDVELTFDLKYFTVNLTDIEPIYLDFLDTLYVTSRQDRDSLLSNVEDTFSIREVTNTFYEQFGEIFRDDLQKSITGLPDPGENLNAYTRLVVNRVLFLLFVEEKGWLNGDTDYIENKYEVARDDPDMHVYHDFFEPLFFNALCDATHQSYDFLGRIPYFNGGLFEEKSIEEDVTVEPAFFDALLNPTETEDGDPKGFLRQYKFSLSESNPSEQELIVDPEFIGRIFEMFMQEAEREEKGTFYTPKPITEYMAKNALKQFLLEDYADHEDAVIELVGNHRAPTDLSEDIVHGMREKVRDVQVVDPAVGSGAFIIAMSEELVAIVEALTDALDDDIDRFELKQDFIRDSLYGVDIDSGGIELCKFRVWLYLIQDLHISIDEFLEQNDRYALPNLGLKFFVGNSLVGDYEPTELRDTLREGDYQGSLTGDYGEDDLIDRISTLRKEYVGAHNDEKQEIHDELQRLTDELDKKISWDSSDHWMSEAVGELDTDEEAFKWSINIPEVLLEGGFDIVIGNPPYKGGTNPDYVTALSDFYEEHRDEYVKPVRKMVYDRYQKFIYRGEELVRDGGVFSYIVNSTFRTIATKTSTRNLLQSNRLQEILLTNIDTFDAAVNAAIFSLQHEDARDRNYQMRYVNGLESPITSYRNLIHFPNLPDNGDNEVRKLTDNEDLHAYQVPINMYRNSIRGSFFEPDEVKQKVYRDYIDPANDLIGEWKEELYDVDRQRDNLDEIREQHINQLEPGDVTLLGLVTWGGEGLKTNNNKEHIAYIDGTDSAERVKDRNEDFQYVEQNENAYNFINRVITDEHTIDPLELSEEERFNGIDTDERDNRTWVPIEKGASTSDVYYKPTEQYIDWSKESLEKISNRRGGRIRDPSYYFRSAVFASRGGAGKYKTKARYINNAVVDSSGVVLISTTDRLPPKYLLGILNSEVTKYVLYHFINGTLNVQAADMRVIPVPVPTEEQLDDIIESIDEAIALQKGETDRSLDEVQAEIDEKIADLYGLDVEYIPRWY
ncbi:Eco57I restriction-modification methylase domain-containing protein [Natrinema versiforme]|uniref:site-specific DNA-methyltransferase (adenine-specific) n=1 Tax=Natrinema versiforme TaxID=88724 RepID=A0A4P8WQ98_9EURY|nr:N-6 DNA methylase [Natrinema versiforme]QCS44683.1 SAM-dependent DNA methyltransferase [Natrinema versiforme]